MSTTKQKIEKEYRIILNNLDAAKSDLKNLVLNNTNLKKIQGAYVRSVEENIDASEQLMHETLEGMVWDNLVVAFFGETNAGKSTIIETMRTMFDEERKKRLRLTGKGEDGKIIGDGQADFTKVYDEYKLNVYGKPITLIDVPGIEGKEEDFIDDIKRALKQAHIVFYVQGHNKKPDTATAEKIKKYLNDWVSVYSIYNVRGGASNYDEEEERTDLYTSDVDKTYLLIEETFKGILGDVYKGNIAIQALLAICSQANFAAERQDLKKTQEKLIKYFGGAKAVYDFSKFENVVKLIQEKTNNFENEILLANKQKLAAQANRIIADINETLGEQSSNIDKIQRALKTFTSDIKNITNATSQKIKRQGLSTINSKFYDLEFEMCDAIDYMDEDEAKRRINNLQNRFGYELRNALQTIVTSEIENMNENLKDKQKKLLDIYQNMSSMHKIQISNIDVNSNLVIEELEYDFGDFAKDVGELGMAIVGGLLVGGPIGLAIGTGAVLLGKVIKTIWGSDEAKDKAKESIRTQIEDSKDNATEQFEISANNIQQKIQGLQNKILPKINNDINNLIEMQKILHLTQNKLTQYSQSIIKQIKR